MSENGFWKVCEALDSERRLDLLRFLIDVEKTEFLSVTELSDVFDMTEPGMSVHLKKLLNVGLVSCKMACRRVYYRAFPTTRTGYRLLDALRHFFVRHPNEKRIRELLVYIHALSHHRRNMIVRCMASHPGLSLMDLSRKTGMPPPTADRLRAELNKARIVDLNGSVMAPRRQPEAVFLELTLG